MKKATSELIDFVNEYLELLDFKEYEKIIPKLKEKIEDSQKSDSHKQFLRDLDIFDKSRLGY